MWCKRDDIGSVGLAGNKVRKLEMELAHAHAIGATHLVTEGSRLSNSARAVAAAAAATGMACTLVLTHDEPRGPIGNLMLDGLFGADVRFVGDLSWSELADQTADVVAGLEAAGERVYRLPIGCASSRGATGFARAYFEVRDQLSALGATFGTIIHASSAGSTDAGLVAGKTIAGDATRIVGVVVAEDVYPDVPGRYLELAEGALALVGSASTLGREDFEITDACLGEGRGGAH